MTCNLASCKANIVKIVQKQIRMIKITTHNNPPKKKSFQRQRGYMMNYGMQWQRLFVDCRGGALSKLFKKQIRMNMTTIRKIYKRRRASRGGEGVQRTMACNSRDYFLIAEGVHHENCSKTNQNEHDHNPQQSAKEEELPEVEGEYKRLWQAMAEMIFRFWGDDTTRFCKSIGKYCQNCSKNKTNWKI